MSAPINDGGPAFPSQHPHGIEEGMTLRDYFAASAMTSCLPGSMSAIPSDEYARWAYRMADAMLKAREASHA